TTASVPDVAWPRDAFVAILHSTNEPPAPVPTITCPSDIVVNAPAGADSAVVDFSVSASSPNTSNCGSTTCTPPPGSKFPLGTTQVSCTTKDGVGATATCTFNVTVRCGTFQFNGFSSPL